MTMRDYALRPFATFQDHQSLQGQLDLCVAQTVAMGESIYSLDDLGDGVERLADTRSAVFLNEPRGILIARVAKQRSFVFVVGFRGRGPRGRRHGGDHYPLEL